MIAWLVGIAWGATPQPCALDNLPDGAISWTPTGVVTLWQGKVKLRDIEVGSAIPAEAKATCTGTRVEIFNQNPRATLAFQQVDLDLADLLATMAPADPAALALSSARAAITAGDYPKAMLRIARLDAKDPRVIAIAAEIRAAIPDDPNQALRAADSLRTVLPPPPYEGWIAVERGRALLALNRAHEAAEEGDRALAAGAKGEGEGSLLRADARWALGDKAGAKSDYETAAKVLDRAAWPATMIERCKTCK
jgi:hypothetical protein